MTSSIQPNYPSLYRSQEAGQDVLKTNWFSRFSPQYVQSQEGFKGAAIQIYNHVYDGLSFLHSGIKDAASIIAKIGNDTLGSIIPPLKEFSYNTIGCHLEPVYNAVYPINPINGERHFIAIPRGVEKFLGDYLFYPLNTLALTETCELLPGTNQSMAQRVENVLQRIYQSNQELLNPDIETTKFDYRAKTVISSDINAFAVPAGGMVVFSQMVKELHGAITSQAIRQSRIEFADGSHVNVDLTGVTLDDVLAALLGHEMTHVASRHSIASIFVGLARSLLLNVARILLVGYIQTNDVAYQQLKEKPEHSLSPSEKVELANRQQLHSTLNGVFQWIQDRISFLDTMLSSRKNEYEADTTGTYLAHQAQFNPLGAIYLQEFLSKKSPLAFLHKHLEFLFSHPYGENRKRTIFASIAELTPQNLRGNLSQWHFVENTTYDPDTLSPAYKYCREIARTLS